MELKGKNFFNKNNNYTYKIIICNNNEKINNMINYFINFMKSKYKIIGMDFEFNRSPDGKNRVIALFQMILQNNIDNPHIYLFYPPNFNNEQLNTLKKLLMDKDIIKIIHGGESLDIPYLFNNIFKTTKEQENFCINLYDTKFLCEYYNIENNYTEYKCKIYHLLKQMDIINDKQLDYLIKNEDIMGPIYKINVDINNLSKPVIEYAVYDVLYLPELYNSFPKTDYYKYIIPEVSRLHFILKQTDFFEKNNKYISYFNNVFLINNIKLIEMYDIIYHLIKYNNFGFMLNIPYFKKFFDIMLKSIVYNNITKKYITFTKKNIVNNYITKNHNNIYIHNNYKYIHKIFNDVYNEIKNNYI
jgi:hypothetical protein